MNIRAAAWGVVIFALFGVAQSTPLEAAEGGLYLAWHAPYGEPRATQSLVTSCSDTARVDTLYLSFTIDRLRPALSSMYSVLYFSPQPGHTLGPFWFFKHGWANQGNMYIDYAPFEDQACEAPWPTGNGGVNYDHRSGRGRLDMWFVVPDEMVRPLEPGRRYCFARVRILHRRADLGGCVQPVCVQWGSARLGFVTRRMMDLPEAGSRFVTWNSTDGEICRPQRGIPLTRPWQPKPDVEGTPRGR